MTEEVMMQRRDSVIGILPEKNYGCRLSLKESDDRFCCSECGKPTRDRYKHSIVVDSQGMVWCTSCAAKCCQSTVRSVKNNPDDDYPKLPLKGGKYYMRLIRSECR